MAQKKLKLQTKCYITVEDGPASTINLAKVRGKDYLICRYKDDKGKLLRKYYPLADIKKANAFVAEKNSHYKAHGELFGSISRDEARAIEAWRSYKKDRMSDGREYKDPATLMHEAITADNGKAITPLLPDIITEYLEHLRKQGKSVKHFVTTRQHLRRFAELFDSREIGELTTDDIEHAIYSLRHYRTGEPVSPVTMQSHRLSMHGLYSYAIRRGIVEKNAAALVETPDIRRKHAPGIITPDVARMILTDISATSPTYLIAVVLAVFLGIRRAELTRLRYQDIDIQRREVNVSKYIAKTGKARYVSIPECAIAWIGLHKFPEDMTAYIIPGTSEDNKDRRYQKAISKTKRHLQITLPPNAFRHSAASYLCAYYEDLPKVALLLGHSVHILNQNYRNAVPHDAGVAYYNIFPQ